MYACTFSPAASATTCAWSLCQMLPGITSRHLEVEFRGHHVIRIMHANQSDVYWNRLYFILADCANVPHAYECVRARIIVH